MKFVLLITVFILTSCGSTGPVSMKPEDAKVPELRFSYWKDGKYQPIEGHAGDHFADGDIRKFKVRLHKKMKGCQLNYVDGDQHFTRDCKGKSEVELDLGTYYKAHPTIVSMSVASKKAGIQVGHFYPFTGIVRDTLPLTVRCPHVDQTKNITACSRPATYDLSMLIKIQNDVAGKLQYQYSCHNGKEHKEVVDIQGAGEEVFSLSINEATYCAVAFALKQGEIKQSHLLHVRFYNPKYIPLPIPNISETKKGFKACAPEDYELYSVNGKDKKNSLLSGDCVSIKGDRIEVLIWDEIGRMSSGIKTKQKIRESVHKSLSFLPTLENNSGWGFYKEAFKWGQKEIHKHCGYGNKKCYKDNIDEVLYHPKMVKAVEAWDSSILYRN